MHFMEKNTHQNLLSLTVPTMQGPTYVKHVKSQRSGAERSDCVGKP